MAYAKVIRDGRVGQHRVLNVKALVGNFNQEKALEEALSVTSINCLQHY